MERRILQPEQIIVPGEYELGNESILKIYFRVFDKGHGENLPPVIVVRSDLRSENQRKKDLKNKLNDLQRSLSRYDPFEMMYVTGLISQKERDLRQIDVLKGVYDRFAAIIGQSPYYLIDGNHRSAAAALTHQPIYALELQSSRDLNEVRKMVKKGDLFDFKRPEKSLTRLVKSFEEWCIGEGCLSSGHIDDVMTVRERIDALTSNGDLPQYMKERYHRSK
ncbi:hypothetical protein KY337_02485 [Candidatus Woesearchaeota archaeon]|nr:hypothetical protein [Candidatus Woesearchaeota archaeon]